MGIALNPENDASVLRLDGVIDVAVAAELKASLLEAIAAGKAIRVSVDEAAELDVAAFQLLWTAGRQATQAGIGFLVTGQMTEAARETLIAMGLDASALSA